MERVLREVMRESAPEQRGVLHGHADGTRHRHFRPGFTIGGQVIENDNGTDPHRHGTLSDPDRSGDVVWIEGDDRGNL